MADPIRMYFSFRSPYSWLGFHRLRPIAAKWDLELDYVPVFPPDPSRIASSATPVRLQYTMEDTERFAAAYGLPVRWPESRDTDWLRPHAAFLRAEELGAGEEFIAQTYRARFQEGADVGTDETLARVADRAGAASADVTAAAWDESYHQRVLARMAEGFSKQEFFGVPTWIYRETRFWGNDRLEWLLRAVAEARGLDVPDLAADPLASAAPAAR